MNPYQAETKSAEFFSCGFLQHTSIFVAESLVDEVTNGTHKSMFSVNCLSFIHFLFKETSETGLISHTA